MPTEFPALSTILGANWKELQKQSGISKEQGPKGYWSDFLLCTYNVKSNGKHKTGHLYSLKKCRRSSPCRTLISTEDWLSAAVENTSALLVGSVVFLGMSLVMTPPRVSRPKLNGVTSSKTMSLTSPAKTPAWTAAPSATTSSGFTLTLGSFPDSFFTNACTEFVVCKFGHCKSRSGKAGWTSHQMDLTHILNGWQIAQANISISECLVQGFLSEREYFLGFGQSRISYFMVFHYVYSLQDRSLEYGSKRQLKR